MRDSAQRIRVDTNRCVRRWGSMTRSDISGWPSTGASSLQDISLKDRPVIDQCPHRRSSGRASAGPSVRDDRACNGTRASMSDHRIDDLRAVIASAERIRTHAGSGASLRRLLCDAERGRGQGRVSRTTKKRSRRALLQNGRHVDLLWRHRWSCGGKRGRVGDDLRKGFGRWTARLDRGIRIVIAPSKYIRKSLPSLRPGLALLLGCG